MKKILFFISAAAFFAASCGTDTGDKKDKTDTSAKITADTLGLAVNVSDLPSGIKEAEENGRKIYIVEPAANLDKLTIGDEDWMRYPWVEEMDTTKFTGSIDWKKIPIDTLLLPALARYVSFSQMCDIPEPHPELFYYASVERSELSIQAGGFQRLRDRRREVIDWYLAKKKDRFTNDDLCIFIDLNAVEMLPDLLREEKEIRLPALLAAEGRLYNSSEMENKGRNYAANAISATHGNLLAAICAILRQEKSTGLLASPMEAELRAKIEAFDKENKPTKESLESEAAGYVFTCTDPVYQLITAPHVKVDVKVSKAICEQVAAWTEDYIANKLTQAAASADKRMTNRPVER